MGYKIPLDKTVFRFCIVRSWQLSACDEIFLLSSISENSDHDHGREQYEKLCGATHVALHLVVESRGGVLNLKAGTLFRSHAIEESNHMPQLRS